jgi:hypothetical protein
MLLLSIAALVFATLFAGAAIYISLVEHPAASDWPMALCSANGSRATSERYRSSPG